MNRCIAVATVCAAMCSLSHADWLSFRGNNGVANGSGPKTVGADSIAWTADIPGRGVSSPIVVKGQVIVTSSSGVRQDRLHVIAFDAATGDVRWHRQFWATGRTLCHPTSANAAPTPASDGENIVAFFSSNDCVCLGVDGDLKWFRGLASDYPKVGNDIGMASSPVVAGGVAVCQAESQGDSFVEGIDVSNGLTLWHLERPRGSNWTSPILMEGDEEDLVLLKGSDNVSAHSLQTGERVWKIDEDLGGNPCIVVTQDRIYVPGATFLALNRRADSVELAWDSKKIKTSPSPIVDGDRLLYINSAGVLNCHDSNNGDQLWQTRVGGKYWASPVTANGFVYTVNDGGKLTIVNPDGEKLADYTLDDNVLGSPVISDGAIFIRGVSKLWKVASR